MRGSIRRSAHKKMQLTQSVQLSRPIVSSNNSQVIKVDTAEVLKAGKKYKQEVELLDKQRSNLLELNI